MILGRVRPQCGSRLGSSGTTGTVNRQNSSMSHCNPETWDSFPAHASLDRTTQDSCRRLPDPQMGQPAVHHIAHPGRQILVLLSPHLKVALRDCPMAADVFFMSPECPDQQAKSHLHVVPNFLHGDKSAHASNQVRLDAPHPEDVTLFSVPWWSTQRVPHPLPFLSEVSVCPRVPVESWPRRIKRARSRRLLSQPSCGTHPKVQGKPYPVPPQWINQIRFLAPWPTPGCCIWLCKSVSVSFSKVWPAQASLSRVVTGFSGNSPGTHSLGDEYSCPGSPCPWVVWWWWW